MLLAMGAGAWHGTVARAEASPPTTGGPPVVLTAAFSPDRLGAAAAISFAMRIDPPSDTAPLPLAEVAVNYPLDLGLATSGLGLEACNPRALEIEGPGACPPDSEFGQGSALVEIPFGLEIVRETASLHIYAAPSNDGYVHLAILVHGEKPVIAQIVLAAVLLPGQMRISIPSIATLPEAPYAAVAQIHATIGGALTYYEHAHGRTIAYRPKGVGLPDTCPRGGFRLRASLAFTDGEHSAATTAIPCPHRGTPPRR